MLLFNGFHLLKKPRLKLLMNFRFGQLRSVDCPYLLGQRLLFKLAMPSLERILANEIAQFL